MNFKSVLIRREAKKRNFEKRYNYRTYRCPCCGKEQDNLSKNWRTSACKDNCVSLLCPECYNYHLKTFAINRRPTLHQELVLIAYDKENNNFEYRNSPIKARYYFQPFAQKPIINHTKSNSEGFRVSGDSS